MILTWLLVAVEVYALLLYPTWYTPDGSFRNSLIVFHLFYLAILAQTILIHRLSTGRKADKPGPAPGPAGLKAPVPGRSFWIITAIYILGIIPFLEFPVLVNLDDHFHTALPAAAISMANRLLLSMTRGYVSIQVASWFGLMIVATAFYLWQRRANRRLTLSPVAGVLLLYPLLLVLAFKLAASRALDRFGDIYLIHRYPPLGKSLFAASYALFGIGNAGGKITQAVFTILTMYVVFLIGRTLPWKSRFVPAILPALFIANPLMWNTFYYNHIEQGTVFFVLIVLYALVRWNDTGSRCHLELFWFSLMAGIFYKQLAIFLLPVIFIFLLLSGADSWSNRITRIGKVLIPVLIVFVPYFLYDRYYQISPAGTTLDFISLPLSPLMPLAQTAAYSGFLLALLLTAGLIYSLWQMRLSWFRCSIIFLFIYLSLMNITYAWTHIRHALPIFPVLTVPAALLLDRLHSRIPKITAIAIVMIFSEMTYCNFFAADNELITFRSRKYYDVAYEDLVLYLKTNNLFADKIYAPHACEPSHFYFYKHDVPIHNYIRTLWYTQAGYEPTVESLRSYLRQNQFSYLVVPATDRKRVTRYQTVFLRYFDFCHPLNRGYPGASFYWKNVIGPELHRELYENYPAYGFTRVAAFGNYENELLLLRFNNGT